MPHADAGCQWELIFGIGIDMQHFFHIRCKKTFFVKDMLKSTCQAENIGHCNKFGKSEWLPVTINYLGICFENSKESNQSEWLPVTINCLGICFENSKESFPFFLCKKFDQSFLKNSNRMTTFVASSFNIYCAHNSISTIFEPKLRNFHRATRMR